MIPEEPNPEVTTYSYYSSSASGVVPLKTVIHSDGSWEWRGQPDSEGKVPWTIYSYGNQPPTDQASLARDLYYIYGTSDSSVDDGTLEPKTPRLVIESVLGTEVGRRYTVLIPVDGILSERRDIVCQAGASVSGVNNLVTVSKYYTSGLYTHKVQSIENPDGTMQLYEYSEGSGQRTNTVYSGQPNGGKTAIINGTKSVTIVGVAGQTLSKTTTDVLSGLVVSSETYFYPSGDYFYQSPRVISLDGRTNIVNWGCCNVDNEIDRDGTTTQYYYDGLKRRIASSRNGVMTSNVLDAAGNVLKTIRVGTNGNQITLSSAGYDLAGRMIAQTNAVDGVTTYSEILSTDHKVRTTTNSDGGTIIENYFVDGSLQSMTGTAVHGERHEKGLEPSGTDSGRPYSKTVRLDGSGADTSEWTLDYTDFLGRPCKTVYAAATTPYPFQQSFFNNKGQLWKDVDPDGVVSLYDYNAKGESVFTAVDVDQNDAIDFGGTDRITFSTNDVTTSSGANVRRARTYVWGDE